jgi:hypothetical protein
MASLHRLAGKIFFRIFGQKQADRAGIGWCQCRFGLRRIARANGGEGKRSGNSTPAATQAIAISATHSRASGRAGRPSATGIVGGVVISKPKRGGRRAQFGRACGRFRSNPGRPAPVSNAVLRGRNPVNYGSRG